MKDYTDLKGLKFPEKKSDNPPTLICGHGGELCNDDGSLQVLDIPENCMFITFADCGLSYGAKVVYDAIVKNQKNLYYFEDPIRYKNELEDIFKRKIHIHHPNAENEVSRTYVNTQYSLIGEHIYDDDYVMSLSGLVPLKKEYTKYIYQTESRKFKFKDLKELGSFYMASIYPTKKQIAPFFGKQLANNLPELAKKIPVVTQQFLFEKRPGIYFNPLCRVNSCDIKSVVNRQYRSSRAIGKNIDKDLNYVVNMIDDCGEFSDCKLFNEKSEIVLEKLDISELEFVKDRILKRAQYFKYDKDNENLGFISRIIDTFIEEKRLNSSNTRSLNSSNSMSIDSSTDNNNVRKIVVPDRPRKQSFNYNLVKVGASRRRRRTRKNKKR